MASTSQYQDSGVSYPNPNVQGNPYIYLAVYSSVPVYEMMVRGIGVMRRRADSWLNATQILKVAGVDKGKRTKILEKDIAQGVHEKVQGGYGRYQGTWIPFERAVELANAFGVSHLLAPLFDYTAPPPPVSLGGAAPPPAIVNPYGPPQPQLPPPPAMQQHMPAPQPQPHPQDASAILHQARQQGLLPQAQQQQHMPPPPPPGLKRAGESFEQDEIKRARLEVTNGFSNGNGYGVSPAPPAPAPAPLPAKPASNFRTTLKPSTKTPFDPATMDPALLERNRTALKSIFAMEPEQPVGGGPALAPDLMGVFPPDLDADTPIDENLHTALHWAAALARVSLVRALVAYGANADRGNNVGETPLIRAVLVTNNSDQDSFLRLLEVLAPSLRTVDDAGRSVLHHAALVAGVKGRAASARYYMETVLEFIATREGGRFKALVDAQDAHGDTALNIAARIGNRALVRMLLDVGADKLKPNKLGLRPTDYGVDDPELSVNAAEETLHALQSPDAPSSAAPVQASSDVLRSLSDTLSALSSSFDAELQAKADALAAKKATLRALASELADARGALAHWRAEAALADDAAQRVQNLARALDAEDAFDWTGRTEIDGSPASQLAGPGFAYRGPESTLRNLPSGMSIEFDADPALPETDGGVSGEALVHLLRLQAWYERVEGLMKQRLERLEGGNGELEGKLRRIVASCCGVEEDKVDAMLDGLVRSLESDPSAMDLPRVAGFLSRVKDGSLA
ncbi:transcriptional regulator swi6 [Rhodotorula kratochvilovae]